MSGSTHRRRLVALAALTTLAFAAIVTRLVHLQLIEGERYAQIAADTLRRTENVRAQRGRILDRAGRVLAHDRLAYRLSIAIDDLDPGVGLAPRIARVLRRPRAELEARWRALEKEAARAPDGPPLAVAEAPSAKSEAAFRRIAKREEGLSVEGRTLFADRALLLRRGRAIEGIAALAGLDPAALRATVDERTARALRIANPVERAARLSTPFTIASSVGFDAAARAEERARELPGLVVETSPDRAYPYGAVGGPILGFVGRAPGGAFDDDVAGRAGVELSYDRVLAGTHGTRLVERDRKTRAFRLLEETPPVAGRDLELAIDIDLQRAAEEALDEAIRDANGGRHGGAVVLLDVKTGEVLAMATAPRYDPIGIRRGTDREQIQRAIAGTLPPASTMKPLVALAALEEGIALEPGAGPLTPQSSIYCRGYLHNPRAFRCDARAGHGPIALRAALAQSCNIYFYVAGERLGEDGLALWARRFGLGEPTGIDLPGERVGLVPTGEWKRRRLWEATGRVEGGERALALAAGGLLARGPAVVPAVAHVVERARRLDLARAWRRRAAADVAYTAGDARNTAIGQGNMLATPLQMACAAAAIANGGRRVVPRIARGPHARPVEPPEPVPLSRASLDAVIAGMRACVEGEAGTARRAGLARFRAAGKTGTAQAGPEGDLAWFMGFAPHDRPEVAFACVIEHVDAGRHGGDVAAPVIARVLEARERLRAAREVAR